MRACIDLLLGVLSFIVLTRARRKTRTNVPFLRKCLEAQVISAPIFVSERGNPRVCSMQIQATGLLFAP